MSKVCYNIPTVAIKRKGIFRDILDINHFKFCTNEDYHSPCVDCFSRKCVCRNCDEPLDDFHARFECNPFRTFPKYDVTCHKDFYRLELKDEMPFKENQVKEIKCAWCSYYSLKKGRVETHIKIVHLKIKEFRCEKCDYKTSQEGTLENHLTNVHQKL